MKYNRKQIMKDAWKMKKQFNITLSAALKFAWKKAKDAAKKSFSNLFSDVWESVKGIINEGNIRVSGNDSKMIVY